MIEPRGAGFEAELTLPFWLMTAAWPVPDPFSTKIPGTAATTGSRTGPSVWEPATTLTDAEAVAKGAEGEGTPAVRVNGTTALIWQFDAYRTGAGNPSKVTEG